jgi:hypothetical protein
MVKISCFKLFVFELKQNKELHFVENWFSVKILVFP